eukprot:2176331-Lingulodinium_polyedra.AAC.1
MQLEAVDVLLSSPVGCRQRAAVLVGPRPLIIGTGSLVCHPLQPLEVVFAAHVVLAVPVGRSAR